MVAEPTRLGAGGPPVTSGRYTKRLRRDLREQAQAFALASEDTLEEEAMLRWIMSEFVDGYTQGQLTMDQLYTNLLVGVETLSKAIQRRLDIQYRKERLISPEELMIIFKLIGSILDARISDRRECLLAANDIAALLQGQRQKLHDKHFEHRNLLEAGSASEVINALIP